MPHLRQLESVRSTDGISLEEERKKAENLRKQVDRIRGFAKSWKAKAEGLTKQVEDEKTALMTQVSLGEARIAALLTEKNSLAAKISSAESSTPLHCKRIASS